MTKIVSPLQSALNPRLQVADLPLIIWKPPCMVSVRSRSVSLGSGARVTS